LRAPEHTARPRQSRSTKHHHRAPGYRRLSQRLHAPMLPSSTDGWRSFDATAKGSLANAVAGSTESCNWIPRLPSEYDMDMDLAEIQHAIEALPPEQQARLAAWLSDRDRLQWDAEIDQDFSPGGAGMELLENVRAQIRFGHSRPMSEGQPRR
jgi:hypothetical protein